MTGDELKRLIARGEGESLDFTREFSSRMRGELHLRLAALANTKGGYLVFGVDPDKNVVGCRLNDNERAQVSQQAKACKPIIRFDMIDVNVDGKEVTVIHVPKAGLLHADKEWRFPQRVADSFSFMDINSIIAALRDRGFRVDGGLGAGLMGAPGPPFFGGKERGPIEPNEIEDLEELINSPYLNAKLSGLSQLGRLAYSKRVEDLPEILDLLAMVIAEGNVEAKQHAVSVFFPILSYADSETKPRLLQRYIRDFVGLLDMSVPVQLRHEAIRVAQLIPDPGIVASLIQILHTDPKEEYERSTPHLVFTSLKAMEGMRGEILSNLRRQAASTVDASGRQRLLDCIDHIERG